MLARFFIDRPIFACVLATLVMLTGLAAVLTLPVERYPDIAPPSISIAANYPGASAETIDTTVIQVIEQQLKGLDRLLYISSTANVNGQVQTSVTFSSGTDPDVAQVQVQNKVQAAIPRLPQAVQQLGVTVSKMQQGFLLIVALYDPSDRRRSNDIADFLVTNFQDPISRVDGVGNIRLFGSQYSMRIWMDPYKLRLYNLMPSDLTRAIQAQNTEISAGEVGGEPSLPGQEIDVSVTAHGRLRTVEEFNDIVLRATGDGAVVRLSDVARVELGDESYSSLSRTAGHPSGGLAIQLAPGANALKTAREVKAVAERLQRTLASDLKVVYPVDSTSFIRASIKDVVTTLIEAIALVVIVMFLFLRNWRATLIPAITVPVVLLGTFGVLSATGFSINTLTLFAMVLAIGLLVDDAIVVVENVERIMREERLSARDATIKSMTEIGSALIAIAMVLSAVFVPMAFFGGSTGEIYRQFSVTIVSAMILSVLVALILTPALCALLLRASDVVHGGGSRLRDRYGRWLTRWVPRRGALALAYAALLAMMGFLFLRLPTSFLPEEDQGYLIFQYTLAAGATQSQTAAVARKIEAFLTGPEARNVETYFTTFGFSFAGAGQNVGSAFVKLRPWSVRKGEQNRASAIARRAQRALGSIREARIFANAPPPILGLGQTNGFSAQLVDRGGVGREGMLKARDSLIAKANNDPVLASVREDGIPDVPQVHVDIDAARAGALGLSYADIDSTVSTAWGGTYVNDFLDRGRVKRVYVQADAPYRSSPESLGLWYVRGATGDMAPFSAFATTRWTFGAQRVDRYNGLSSLGIQGSSAPNISSGAAMNRFDALAASLGNDIGLEWSGLSFQEQRSRGQTPLLYGTSIIFVFLCLAALYESLTIPVAIMLMIPLGIVGAVLAATMRGFFNDIYFQIGLLTTVGLSAKNAVLIVEFAAEAQRRGLNAIEAAIQGARLRLRPILMTSLAFVAGVFPLAIAGGPSAGSQNDIGTAVVGGVLTATVLCLVFVPFFYVTVRSFGPRRGASTTLAGFEEDSVGLLKEHGAAVREPRDIGAAEREDMGIV